MVSTKKALLRRTFLRGMGATVALPHRPLTGVRFVGAMLLIGVGSIAQAQSSATSTQAAEDTARIASLPGEPHSVSAAGVTRDDVPLMTIESRMNFEPTPSMRHVVLVGGLDGDPASARIVLDAVQWFKTSSSATDRAKWTVSALPMSNPSTHTGAAPLVFPPAKGFFDDTHQPESRYVWRWATYQAPDLIVEVRAAGATDIRTAADAVAAGKGLDSGSLAREIADPSSASGVGPVRAILATAKPGDGAALMRRILQTDVERSPLREVLAKRAMRSPLVLARQLAVRYPATPAISYVPAVAWAHTLRLASMTGDDALRRRVLAAVQPWLDGQKQALGDRIQLTTVAGTLIFAELARTTDPHPNASRLAAEGVTHAVAQNALGLPPSSTGWTDDMFMASTVLARSGTDEGRAAAVRLLSSYAAALQRADGLFNHAPASPAAWGRGNGFAMLGLTETLNVLAPGDPSRERLLAIYRRQMAAMQKWQAPDGMWREVVDQPGSYRELSVTAMTVSAMARGIRLGWLDRSYRENVDRAWHALSSRIDDEGNVVDACTSTGAGPSLRYYLDRPAVSGPDDRAGAFALGAALDVNELNR